MSAGGLTWLQLINKVLPRLREATVAANNTTTYSSLIGSLINQVKSEMEDAYFWSALRDIYSVSAVAGTVTYALTGAGMNAAIISGWNTTTGLELSKGTNQDFDAKYFGVGTSGVQTGNVEQYLDSGFNASYDLVLDVWPSPSSTNLLKFTIYKPQADLAADGDIPLVPQSVLIEETVARAMVERGDETAPRPQPGQTFIMVDLLDSAIARESGRDDSETDWEVV